MKLALILAALTLVTPAAMADTQVRGLGAAPHGNTPAFAAVVGVPAALTRDGVAQVGDGALSENTIFLFPERQGVTLSAPLQGGSRPVPAGTRVDSFYLCADTSDPGFNSGPRDGTPYAGRARFDNPDLLAVILRPQHLATSAQVLGRPGVVYADSRFLGVDPFWMGQDDQRMEGTEFTFFGEANGIDCRRLMFRARG